jgi:OmpA-OmpF porin, OOP family
MSERNIILLGLALLAALAFMCAGHITTASAPTAPAAPRAAVVTAAPASPPAPAPVSAPKALPTAKTNIAADWRGGKAVLTGEVPSVEIKSAIAARALQVFGNGNVEDKLTVGAGGTVPALAAAADVFFPPDMQRYIAGNATFDGEKLSVTGEVESEASKATADAALRAAADLHKGLTLASTLNVTAGPKDKDDLQARLNREVALATVEFKSGSAELTANGRAILDRVAPLLKSMPAVPVAIIGHTDNVGNEAGNVRLSGTRAATVKAYLARAGVASARMTTSGVGSREPIASNDTDEGRQRNRRIAFKL